MRGESGEAIVGSGTAVTGDDIVSGRQDGGDINKSPASPPLSAAASQVSLAQSDLTISDPDIAGSSAYSSAPPSRPPSSSQMSLTTSDLTNSELDLAMPSSVPSSASSSRPPSSSEISNTDIVLPAPEDYTAETVEFPRSPLALKVEGGKENGVCFLEADEINGSNSRCTTPSSMYLTPNYKPDEVDNPDGTPKQADGFEVGSDLEEDYFEEFHLPNSHENAFVRHKSFRRKVNLTPIDAPDAEKIEGLVRTGEFQRHGSIRRKITEEPVTSPEDDIKNDRLSLDSNENIKDVESNARLTTEVGTFAKDLREIESMLDDNDNIGEDMSDIIADTSFSKDGQPISFRPLLPISNTSTPIPGNVKPNNYLTMELSMSVTDESVNDESNEESLSIEQSTLMKVKECLDFTKYKDLYNLSGRLQDILTPKEVEEILVNSHRYSDFFDKEIMEALHNSLQEHLTNSNSSENVSSGNADSGISSPKRMISAEGAELGNSDKSEIRAVLDGTTEPVKESEVISSKRLTDIALDDDPEDEDTGFRFERRRSLRLTKEGVKELEVEGVFVESKTQDIGLKKIPAPEFDLSGGTNEDYTDEIPDLSTADPSDTISFENTGSSSAKSSDAPKSRAVPVSLPDIVITNFGDELEENKTENDVSKLTSDVSGFTEFVTPTLDSSGSKFEFETPDEERPSSLNFGNFSQRKRISVADDILQSPIEDDNISVASAFSCRSDGEDDIDDEFEAPEINIKSKIYPNLEPLPPPPPDQFIPEFSAAEETSEERHWRSVVIGGVWRRIDMKVIAPYRKCVSHGGYLGDTQHAVIVICACQLPDRSRRDYNYVMDNLFLYVLSTLEQLIADDYVLVYLAGGTPKSHMPNFHWLKRAYQMIDRKLRKNLKALHVVHPTFWVRTVVAFSRPFISTKFYRKLSFVNNLTELAQMVPLDQLEIPDAVKQADFELMIKEKKKNMLKSRGTSATSR